jgi:hypothetical protein
MVSWKAACCVAASSAAMFAVASAVPPNIRAELLSFAAGAGPAPASRWRTFGSKVNSKDALAGIENNTGDDEEVAQDSAVSPAAAIGFDVKVKLDEPQPENANDGGDAEPVEDEF